MKRVKILLPFFCILCGITNAQTITVNDVEALPGETVAFSLSLQDGKADTYISLQFDATFPATGFTTTGDYIISSQWKNATSVIGDVDAEGVATIPVSSAETIIGTNVDNLITVSFKVGNDVALGEYDVTLTKITFGYNINDKDIAPDVTFKVKVVGVHTMVLDENSATVPEFAESVNVRLNRTIKGGIWSTIVLPFDATGEQVKAAFGSDVELAEFKAWSSEEDDEGAIVGINVEFASVDADEGIAANTPMIIKTGSDVTTATFDGVTIDPEEEPAVQVGKRASERAYFYGTYVSMKVPEENVFLKDNMFWYSTGNTTIKGYRGFFAFRDVLDAYYDVADVRFNFFLDNVETSIDGLKDGKVNKEEQEIYNLAGQRIRRAQHGVNIINGKKIVKR